MQICVCLEFSSVSPASTSFKFLVLVLAVVKENLHNPNMNSVFFMPVRLLPTSKSMSSPMLTSTGDVRSTEVD